MLAPLATVLVAAPLLLAGLGRAPFDDPGEGMHAEIARELGRSGDPLRLTLNGVPYVDKPPLLYLLMAGTFALAGPGETAARFVPALAALAAVAVTAWHGARLLGGGWGTVAGAALLTSAGFFAYGRYVRPETLFVAALAAGFALALGGLTEGRRRLVVLGLAAFGLAALAKDPLGALAPPLAVGAALGLARRARPVSRWLPAGGVLLLIALAAGWLVAAEVARPGVTWYTVVDNHLLNVARARHFPDEDVPLSALEFLVAAIAGATPWVLPAGAMVWTLARRGAWRDPREVEWTTLALWATGVLGLTALSGFRLPHYGLPAYPAVALLAARGWRELGARRLAVAHAVVFGVLAGACALAWASEGTAFVGQVVGVADVATRKTAAIGAGAPVPPWAALRPLVGGGALVFGAGAVAVALAAARDPRRPGGRALAAGAVAVTMLALLPLVAAALGLVSEARAVKPLAQEVARRAAPGDVVAHEGPIENSGALEWYAGIRPVIVDGRRSVLGFGATRAGAGEVFWEPARLTRAWQGERRVWLVTGRPPGRSVADGLAGARLVAAAGGRRLYVNR